MILQPTHTHDHHSQGSEQHSNPSILESLMSMSQQALNQQSVQEIGRLRRYCEQKVYLSFSDDPNQYLLHMLHKSQNQIKDEVAQLIMGRQMKVTNAIKNQKYEVRINNDRQKIKNIQNELSGKIQAMRKNIASISGSDMSLLKDAAGNSQELYNGYMQFRKRGYWNQKSEQSIKVRKFIGKMRKKRKEVESVHEKNLQQLSTHIKQAEEKDKKDQEDEKKRFIQEMNRKRERAKEQKESKRNQDKKKLNQAQNFLNKYKTNKPIYLLNEEKFKKEVLQPMQAQTKRKLAQIRKSKRPIDSQQLQLHQQRYEQFKEKLMETFEKKEQDREIYERNMEKLKELYHGKFHEQFEEEQTNNSYRIQLEEKRKNRQRIMAYGESIKQEHKPRVDDKKRQQVQKTIKLLELKSERGKKRILKGNSVILEELTPDQPKKLGVSYLQNLRKLNEGKIRKTPQERSASMMDLNKKPAPYHDYLKQMRTHSRIQSAKTSDHLKDKKPWQKILNQQGFSNRDKYNSVMDHVTLLESEAKQKQLQLKYMKNGTKAMQLKQRLDKYYLESVAAKMHVLKDVILKE